MFTGFRSPYCIYGAQVVAYGAYRAIKHLTGRAPECFIVSCPDGNPAEIEGISVRTLDAVPKDWLVIVGVSALFASEITGILLKKGYKNVFVLTNREEFLLMSAYFDSLGQFPLLDASAALSPADVVLYEVINHRDMPLGEHPDLLPFERCIQAGAALTDRHIASLTDDTGENISTKNRQYCEMSVAYWIWKNSRHEWVGLEHYRRHLLVRPEQLHNGIDAVLPLPYLAYPDTLAQFRRFVSQNVVDALLVALRELHPLEYDAYLKILHGKQQYTYNLVCAKKVIYDQYCSWLFRITEYMETLTDITPEFGTTRALGYVAEVLTNLYFMSHQDTLNIRHAEKEIYI